MAERISYLMVGAFFTISLVTLTYLIVTFPQRMKDALHGEPRRRASDLDPK
jgi:uncharacterized membrane protein YkgB